MSDNLIASVTESTRSPRISKEDKTTMDDFDFNSMDIERLSKHLMLNYGIEIKSFFDELVKFVSEVEFILGEFNSPTASIMICNTTIIFVLNIGSCSERFCSLLRRRLGLNAIDRLPSLDKYSVTKAKITFYVECCQL